MMGYYGYGVAPMGWLGWLGMVLFWALIVLGIIYLVRAMTHSPSQGASSNRLYDSAMEVLRRRYAEGEIDSEEFETRKRVLEQHK